MAKSKPKDTLMQFMTLKAVWPGVTSALTEGKKPTGLSVRGDLAMLVHRIWFHHQGSNVASSRAVHTVSQIQDLAAMPLPGDKGYIASCEIISAALNQGKAYSPNEQTYLPPYPIAAPDLSLYIQTDTDDVSLDGYTVQCVLGYTTQTLDDAVSKEISDTWYRT